MNGTTGKRPSSDDDQPAVEEPTLVIGSSNDDVSGMRVVLPEDSDDENEINEEEKEYTDQGKSIASFAICVFHLFNKS